MLDIKLIRTDPDAVKEGIRKRCLDLTRWWMKSSASTPPRRELGAKPMR